MIEKSFNSSTKTLTAKWKVDGYLDLKNDLLTSDIISSDQYPDQWSVHIYPDGDTMDSKGYMSLYLNKHDDNLAKVDFKFSVGNEQVVKSSFFNFYEQGNWGFSRFVAHKKIVDSLVNQNTLEIVLEITYLNEFDTLTTKYEGNNVFKVNWTINNFKQRLGKPVGYGSDLFACSDYPDAKFELILVNKHLVLAKGSKSNNVKIVAKLIVNGERKDFKPPFDYSTIKNEDEGIQWLRTIDIKTMKTSSTVNLVFEVDIIFQVIQANKNPFVKFRTEFELFKSGNDYDFTIKAQDGDGTMFDITVLKSVLEQRWAYFKTMLAAGLIEAMNNEMVIEDFDANTVKNLIKYLYYRSTSVSDVKSALDLLKIAHRYELADLYSLCEKFICSYVHADDVIHTLMAANLFGSKQLEAACKQVFVKEAKPLHEYPNYLELRSGDVFGHFEALFDMVFPK